MIKFIQHLSDSPWFLLDFMVAFLFLDRLMKDIHSHLRFSLIGHAETIVHLYSLPNLCGVLTIYMVILNAVGSVRGGLDTVTLLNSEDYNMISEQRTLQDILSTIDGVQSRVHLLQDRLSKAHSEGEKLAFSGGNTLVSVVQKRQRTQKRPFAYTNTLHTKPQKKKNLNILLKNDNGQALAEGPALPDRDANIKDISGSAEETSGECNRSREKAITLDLLLGIGNSITNNHIGDLCKVVSFWLPLIPNLII